MSALVLGLLTGVAFGVLLQKGRVTKPDVILGQLLLRDFTVMKIMGTAIVVGAIGFHFLAAAGLVAPSIKPMLVAGVLIGAVLFGAGMALLGYCPGTTVGACGEGRRDAWVGLLGMVAGAFAFVAAWPLVKPVIRALGDAGEITLASATGTQSWLWVVALVVGALLLLLLAASVAVHRRRIPGERPSRA